MAATIKTRLDSTIFPYLLLLSGFAGISYELLYARMLGNIIGDQWTVSAAILLTFLLGIGIGSRFAHRFWRYLWLIEAGIGLYAVLFAFGAGAVESLLYASSTAFGHALGFTLLQCIVLLALPALMIGIGLPLFAGYLGKIDSGLAFARAYGWHSLGAALTILLVEFWLFRQLGLKATVLLIASINFLVAVLLKAGYGEIRRHSPESKSFIVLPPNQLAALGALSIASAIFQLWLVRVAEMLLGPFRETFALVLALVLMGIAFGTWLVRKFRIGFTDVVLTNMCGLIWLIVGLEPVSEAYASMYEQAAQGGASLVLLKLGLLTALGGLPAVTFGATIPALITSQDNVARESGYLLFISSMANALGFLLMVFFLHEHLGYGQLVVLIAAISAVGLVIFRRGRPAAVAIGAVVIAAMGLAHGGLWKEPFIFLGYDNLHSVQALKKARIETAQIAPYRGPQDVFALNTMKNGETFLFINGYRSMNLNTPLEHMVGALSTAFAPRNDHALVLGVGSGATAATVGLLFDEVDAVEINAVLLENLDKMSDYNFDLEHAKNVRIFHDDGIRFSKTADSQYSLIINTVTTPRYFSSSKLYTLDFLQLIRSRLTADGIYATWFDSRIGDKGINISLKTLSQVFDQCAMNYLKYGYYLLFCSDEPLSLRQMGLLSEQTELRTFFGEKYRVLSRVLPYSMLSSNVFRELMEEGSLETNTLDYPALEFEMARLRGSGTEDFVGRLIHSMSLQEVAELIGSGQEFDPAMLLVYASLALGENPISERWAELLREQYPDSNGRITNSKLAYLNELAEAFDTPDSRFILGFELMRAAKFGEAIEHFLRTIKRDPEYSRVNFYVAYCMNEAGRPGQALKYLGYELKLSPSNVQALTLGGVIHLKAGRPHEALPMVERATEIEGSFSNHYLHGRTLAALGQTNSARVAFETALDISPGNQAVLKELEKLDKAQAAEMAD